MFASIKKSCIFVLGLSKEVLSPINLLVISFSVINYVVRVRVHARCVDAHFFCIYPILRFVWSLRQARLPAISQTRMSGFERDEGIFAWLTLAFEDRVSHVTLDKAVPEAHHRACGLWNSIRPSIGALMMSPIFIPNFSAVWPSRSE